MGNSRHHANTQDQLAPWLMKGISIRLGIKGTIAIWFFQETQSEIAVKSSTADKKLP